MDDEIYKKLSQKIIKEFESDLLSRIYSVPLRKENARDEMCLGFDSAGPVGEGLGDDHVDAVRFSMQSIFDRYTVDPKPVDVPASEQVIEGEFLPEHKCGKCGKAWVKVAGEGIQSPGCDCRNTPGTEIILFER